MSLRSKIAGIGMGIAFIVCIAACDSDLPNISSGETSAGIPAKSLEYYEFDPSLPLIDCVREDADFSLREDITFYGKNDGPLIHASQAPELYRELEETPFVSLYASQNWAEDFAEYCLWYYLTTSLDQPYRIIISRDGTAELAYEPMESYLVQERTGVPSL